MPSSRARAIGATPGIVSTAVPSLGPPVEAIELLILGLGSKDLKVRTAAVGLLRKGCYGRYHGYSPEQTEDNRNEAIGKWTDWYRANRTKLKWAPDYRKFLLPGQEPE